MIKKFVYSLAAGESEVFLTQCRRAAKAHGAAFDGDGSQGQFGGHGVAGYYRVTGKQVEVTVTKKPFILPWSIVETTLKKFFAQGCGGI